MKLYRYITVAIVLITTYSCSDFLEYRDKDKVIPGTLQHYNELVYGEILTKDLGNTLYSFEFMADDMADTVETYATSNKSDGRKKYYNYYIWEKEPQITKDGDEDNNKLWEAMYQKILMCNIVENEVSQLTLSFDEEYDIRKRIVGEVQFARAMCYYYLVNIYADVYKDATQAQTAMGVPINNAVSIYPASSVRSTLAAVCLKMETDLKSALINLSEGEQKNTIFRPNVDVVRLLMSRLYIMMHRYDETIAVCDELISKSSKVIAPLGFISDINPSKSAFLSKSNPGIIFSWWKREVFYTDYSYAKFATAPSLLSLYVNDYRSDAFFGKTAYDLAYNRRKFSSNYSGLNMLNYRIEEAYFTKAEAMIKRNSAQYNAALDVVNTVRTQRIKPGGVLLRASSPEEAWTKIKSEKRMEFCFEDMRWFDIRRWNERVIHRYHDINSSKEFITYVLESGSPNYVMSLPFDVVRINEHIQTPNRIDSKIIAN